MTSRYLINNKCNFTRIMNKKIEIKYAFDIKYNIKYKLDITNLYSLLMIQSYLYHDELSERFNQLVTDRQKLYTDRKQRRNTLSSSLYVIFAVYLKFLARCTAAVRHVVPCVSFIKASRSVSRALLDPNSNPGLEVERFDLTLTRSHWTMLLLCPIVVATRYRVATTIGQMRLSVAKKNAGGRRVNKNGDKKRKKESRERLCCNHRSRIIW